MTWDYSEYKHGLPRATYDRVWFHHLYWKKIAEECKPPWLQMSPAEKRKRVHAFIFQKFTLDPRNRCMVPGPGQKRKQRNEASWPGFWLSDQELDGIVAEVMTAFEAPWPLHEVA